MTLSSPLELFTFSYSSLFPCISPSLPSCIFSPFYSCFFFFFIVSPSYPSSLSLFPYLPSSLLSSFFTLFTLLFHFCSSFSIFLTHLSTFFLLYFSFSLPIYLSLPFGPLFVFPSPTHSPVPFSPIPFPPPTSPIMAWGYWNTYFVKGATCENGKRKDTLMITLSICLYLCLTLLACFACSPDSLIPYVPVWWCFFFLSFYVYLLVFLHGCLFFCLFCACINVCIYICL